MDKNDQLAFGMSKRLIKLRKEKHMSQKEFATKFSVFMGRETKLSVSCVSSWETACKRPSYEMLIALSNFYGVSVEYILGISSNISGNNKNIFDMEDFIVEISPTELSGYDGKPVFLVFYNGHENSWGIYNRENNWFCCKTEIIRYNNSIRLFAATPESLPSYSQIHKKLDYKMFQKAERFWIEYSHEDAFISRKYSGWYHHTGDHSAIINDEGNILPYSGLGVHYSAYSDKPW